MSDEYVIVVYPNVGAPESEDVPDAFGPLTLSAATAARESVLSATPNVGIEIARLNTLADFFDRHPLP